MAEENYAVGDVIHSGDRDFTIVDGAAYAAELRERNANEVFAHKTAPVLVSPVAEGDELVVYNGDGMEETRETAKEGQVKLTKANPEGEAILDENGNANSWFCDIDKFEAGYDVNGLEGSSENGYSGLAFPVEAEDVPPRRLIQVDQDISVLPNWGGTQEIPAGGWLNVTDLSDIYGISGKDFDDTYKIDSLVAGPMFEEAERDAALAAGDFAADSVRGNSSATKDSDFLF